MTDDELDLSRRGLLAGLTGVGGVAAASGALTAARLSDLEVLGQAVQAGTVAVDADCWAGRCESRDGRVALPLDDIEPGDLDLVELTFGVEDNPARVWLGAACPPAVDPLGATLLVRLSVGTPGDLERLFPAPEEGSDGGDQPAWGTLDELRSGLAGGLRLDDPADPCYEPGRERRLRIEYTLPEDATWTEGSTSELELSLYAEQCRHVGEADATSPFADRDCPEPDCPDCVELGKLEVEDDRLEPRTYGFDELSEPFASDDRSYALDVASVGNTPEGETVCAALRLLVDGEESRDLPICSVEVAGGPDPGSRGPNRVTYEVDPPTSRTRGQVCTEQTEAGNSGQTVRPAISHVVVSVCPASASGGDAS